MVTMPRPKSGVPSLRMHKASGQAVVTIDGKDHYLGQWGKHEALISYRRAIGDMATKAAECAMRRAIDEANENLKRLESFWLSIEKDIKAIKESIWMFQELVDGKMPKDDRYPDPPSPMGKCGLDDLPSCSGIYFLHNRGGIEYVGKSNDLRSRIGVSNYMRHHAARANDHFSFLQFPFNEIQFVECYYIWLLKPIRNFGGDKPC
jgi:hypothetical protein